ncbi:unnamed protein product [Chironomus riparius]|uniref:UDP-glucuronosyltransferase n=1 Tax=Chironomus riparius TaxID=315576 RepID=A0A9N9S4G5_9DIPT|nr:unnamed protein product [Chironomus riparius]
MKFLINLVVIIAVTNAGTLAANILAIFPAPSYSHTIASKVLTQALAERGHYVYLITTDPRPMNHPNITQIDLSFSYKMWEDGFDFVWYKENNIGVETMINAFTTTIYDVLVKQLNSTGVQYLINHRDELKFDLVIIEAMGFLPYHAFADLFDAPLIGFNSFDAPMEVHLMQGNFVNPFVVNEAALFPYVNHRLSFFERWNVLKTFVKIIYTISIRPDIWNRYTSLTQRFFPMIDASPLELLHKIEFLMVNTHPALGFSRPMVPTTIQLGFIHIQDAKPLPTDLQKYMDNSKNGVIYMSLGSNVKSSKLNPKFVKIFLRVFESLDYDVIWKWESNVMENQPDNVLISKWLPQRDLLDHKNIKLFITQGGHQSMEEGIHCAVPMLVIPFLGDQYANANRLEQRKVGNQIDLLEMSEETLKDKILEVLKPEYKQNMVKLRDLVYDQPMTSLDKAIFWTEYVIRHKGVKHLEFAGRNVPYYQQYCLDFIAIFILSAISIGYIGNKFYKKFFKNFIDRKNKIE